MLMHEYYINILYSEMLGEILFFIMLMRAKCEGKNSWSFKEVEIWTYTEERLLTGIPPLH